MGSVSDMLEAWVIATFVLFTTSFWEEDRRLVISAFSLWQKGLWRLDVGGTYTHVCAWGRVCLHILCKNI